MPSLDSDPPFVTSRSSGSSGSQLLHGDPVVEATDTPHSAGISLSSLHFSGTLGRGGCGKVLLADSLYSSIQVAVKVYGKRYMTRDDAQEVQREVQLLRMLSGQNRDSDPVAFVQLMYTTFQTKEHVFIVMVL